MDELLGLLSLGELRRHFRVTDHHITVPMSAAHIAAILPTARVSQFAHFLDGYKWKSITVKGNNMGTAFLRNLVRLFLRLGQVLGSCIKTGLDFLLQYLHLVLQALQLILLAPRLSGNTLVLGNVLPQFFISLLILPDIPGNLFKSLHSVAHGSQSIVLAHGQLAVVVIILVVALQIELITRIDFLPHLLIPHIDGVHHQRKAIDITHFSVFVADGSSCIL